MGMGGGVVQGGDALPQQGDANQDDSDPGERAENRIEPFRDDIAGGEQRQQSEREDGNGMCHSDDRAEEYGLLRSPALTDQIGRDHRLAMSRRKGAECPEDESQSQREQNDRQGERLRCDGLREGILRRM